jgi:hypothetical protein
MSEERREEMEELNKQLTEAMGECWHNWKMIDGIEMAPFRGRKCQKCGLQLVNPPNNLDFLTWEGFGKLREYYDTWTKGRKDEFWNHILYANIIDCPISKSKLIIKVIHKDNFASYVKHFN